MKAIKLLLIFSLISTDALAQTASPWNLPQKLDDSNTKIAFDVDTTWHIVHGAIKGITGAAKLSDPANPLSISAEIHVPVKSIDTGWGMRNSSLYDHMAADSFPEIIIRTKGIKGSCLPETVTEQGCKAILQANLSIRDVSKDVDLDIEIKKTPEGYHAAGKYSFAWADYKVEDPSIVMAKVNPTVEVKYSVTFGATSN